jgi:aminopeptidase-like protein
LSRFPYPEYHSSRDNINIIREASLEEAVDTLLGAIDELESSPVIIKKFEGNICLSNPKYDLYVDYGQVALGDALSDHQHRMRNLMDFVPALNRPATVKAVTDYIGVPYSEGLAYLEKWAACGLIDLV